MDIAPVSAIRPVTTIGSFPGASDLSRVSETQHRQQSGNDEYSSADDQARRGLEDEEDQEVAAEDPVAVTAGPPPSGKVSFFA